MAKGKISIFLKEIHTAKPGNDHWLLVQTHRQGLVQQAQSAWRIFPDVVDLADAEKPIDVLKAFVEVFGLELNLGGITGKFIESIPVKRGEDVKFNFLYRGPFFNSVSHTDTDNPNIVQVGAAYCIDVLKYAVLLEQKKLITTDALDFVRKMAGGPIVTTHILA